MNRDVDYFMLGMFITCMIWMAVAISYESDSRIAAYHLGYAEAKAGLPDRYASNHEQGRAP